MDINSLAVPEMAKKNGIEKLNTKTEALYNNIFMLGGALGNNFGQQLSKADTMIDNNRYSFVSINRIALSWFYVTFGIVQTLIDQPVDDAFRGGIKIKSSQLSPDEIEDLHTYLKDNGIIETIKQAIKWKRLYGGAGIIINTVGNPGSKLNPNIINEKTPLEFYAADMWELSYQNVETYGEEKPYLPVYFSSEDPFFFYGITLSKSRVLKIKGKEAPAILRPQLRGWGMSQIEAVIRDANGYMKSQNVIFELLDEAKIDVWKMLDYNASLMTPEGTTKIANTVQATNRIKNFQNAILMDKNDEYEQKQVTFTGLAEMSQETRVGIASSLRMPLTKIFGLSAAGFNSGEDDIENYNTIVEAIRTDDQQMIMQVIKICCQKKFGFMPDDIDLEYKSLRVLPADQEENVKTSQYNRILAAYDRGLITADQFEEQVNAANLMPTQIKNKSSQDFPEPPPQKPKLDLTSEPARVNSKKI
jgi:phage-related protein (TIGR01555 family)